MEQRKISIGFVKPKELEGNTIYVQITQDNGSILAKAISAEKFNCFEYSGDRELVPTIATETSNKYEILGNPSIKYYKHFLTMLKTENAGVFETRFEKDGLELSSIVTNMLKGITGKGLLDFL